MISRPLVKLLGVSLIFLGTSLAQGEEIAYPVTEISGFADVQWNFDKPEGDAPITWGQAEVDLSSSISSWMNVETALAYDPEGDSFGLGALVFELRLWGDSEGHRHTSGVFSNAGLMIGQFDVPFGIDWLFYPSIDRPMVRSPLSTDNIHGGWNDTGCAFFAETKTINAIIYGVNGDGLTSLVPDETMNEETDGACGGRIGVAITEGLEIGASYATKFNDHGDESQRMLGCDCQYHVSHVSMKGEFMDQKVGLETPDTWEHKAYYGQALFNLPKNYFGVRYGAWSPDNSGGADQERIGYILGWIVDAAYQLRLEFEDGLGDMDDEVIFQSVVGF